MAIFSVEFFSTSLRRFTAFKAVLPNDMPMEMVGANPHYQRPMKTLILLHGYSGSENDWLMNTIISEKAGIYNLAVIFPQGDNSFYLDGPETGRSYCTYIGEELPQYVSKVFGLSERREDTFIGGFSMGGFGALHTAFAFPERFAKVLSFSSALIHHNMETMTPATDDGIANYDYYRMVFGPLEELPHSANNPEYLLEQLQLKKQPIPKIFMCIGTEDFLYEPNQIFRSFLTEHKVDFQYQEGPGAHDFHTVSSFLEDGLKFLVEGKK